MKKIKRLLSSIAAISALASFMSVSSTNALFCVSSGSELEKTLDGYTEAENFDILSSIKKSEYIDYAYCFINNNRNIQLISCMPNEIYLEMSLDSNIDFVNTTISEICPDAIVNYSANYTDRYALSIRSYDLRGSLSYEDANKINITEQQAKKIYDTLSEKCCIQKFGYCFDQYNIISPYAPYLTSYSFFNKGSKEELIEEFESYISEKNLDCHVSDFSEVGNNEGWKNSVCVVPNNEITAIEHLELANQIYNDLGMSPMMITASSTNTNGSTIDMANNTPGDANADETLDIADAVMIMQSISNPDEYQLTAQGRYNADIAGDNDGITVEDALAIQKKLTGLE